MDTTINCAFFEQFSIMTSYKQIRFLSCIMYCINCRSEPVSFIFTGRIIYNFVSKSPTCLKLYYFSHRVLVAVKFHNGEGIYKLCVYMCMCNSSSHTHTYLKTNNTIKASLYFLCDTTNF